MPGRRPTTEIEQQRLSWIEEAALARTHHQPHDPPRPDPCCFHHGSQLAFAGGPFLVMGLHILTANFARLGDAGGGQNEFSAGGRESTRKIFMAS